MVSLCFCILELHWGFSVHCQNTVDFMMKLSLLPVLRKTDIFNISKRIMSTLDTEFENAKTRLGASRVDLSNETKLKLYALFKQATVGSCGNTVRPGIMDLVGRAKWDAWSKLGSLSAEEAKKNYVDCVHELVGPSRKRDAEVGAHTDTASNILTKKEGKIFYIIINRPNKKNAITLDMYDAIKSAMEAAARDDHVFLTVLTGKGDYFSSGTDLTNFLADISDKVALADKFKELLQTYVGAYIDHPKPLIGLVNGPAIGISVTVLGLFDIVYASDKATFHTPFTSLGLSPEGCASLTFPRLMGLSKASEFLLFGRKLTAVQACNWGLVTEVFSHSTFERETTERIRAFAQLPPQSVQLSKRLVRDSFRKELRETNVRECELIRDRWLSDECAEAVMKFFSSKSKL